MYNVKMWILRQTDKSGIWWMDMKYLTSSVKGKGMRQIWARQSERNEEHLNA